MSRLARTVATSILAKEQAEGVGARVRRSIGTAGLRNLDPFLMLDEFHVTPPAGFSDHPHRGFETVTYMLSGAFDHEDFAGHAGRIGPGDLQWMSASRGIVHAEVPVDDGDNAGLQLWVNLPAHAKMAEPKYQELKGTELPVAKPSEGVEVKVIAGEAFGASAKVRTYTPICYFDVTMAPGTQVTLPVPSRYNAFAYFVAGDAKMGTEARAAPEKHCVVLNTVDKDVTASQPDSEITVQAGTTGARFVFLGGEPIGEPIVQHGPFVMNTYDEIRQAMEDYYAGRNGFERAKAFKSKIAERVARW